jgi:hypothetical protein
MAEARGQANVVLNAACAPSSAACWSIRSTTAGWAHSAVEEFDQLVAEIGDLHRVLEPGDAEVERRLGDRAQPIVGEG